jgi:hypothetical protein
LASNVEDALFQAGAEPGRDYTILDCFKLAQPFMLHMFAKEGNDIDFACSWPVETMRQGERCAQRSRESVARSAAGRAGNE